MMRFLKAPNTALLLWLCASCSSSILTNYPEDAYLGIDAFEHGEFSEAAQEFFALSGTLGSNDFLAHAEAGMAYHVDGNLEASTREWLAALKIVDGFKDRPTVSGRSVTEGALSMLVNDKAVPYDGEGFEVILLHSFLAWDYLRQGNLDDAMVEVKRGYEFERFERERYENTTGMNHFGRFIAALAQDIDGQYNDARIDLERLAEKIPNHPVVVYSQKRIKRLLSSKRQEELSFSEIVVVFENGLMPEKIAEDLHYNTKRSFGRLSVPRFSHVPKLSRSLQVKVANSSLGATVSLENVMQVGRNNLNDRIAWVTTKALLRSAAKTIIVDHVAEEVEEEHGQWAGVFVGLAGSLLNSYSESPDLRSWLTLPNDLQVLRARIEPGEHRIVVHTSSKNPPLDLGIYSFEAGSPVMISVRAIGNRLYVSPRAHSDSLP